MTRRQITLSEVLEETDERLGQRPEPEVLTLTEKNGLLSQRARFNKRLAVEDTSDYKVVRRFDIAFNPYLLWAGAVAQNVDWDEGIISPLYPTFRLRPGYEPRYIDRLLRSPHMVARYDSIAFGSVPRKRRTSVADFLALQIAHPPPLPQQRRIAEILDKADALRAKRRAALEKLDELTQSIFLDMFGDLFASECDWPVTSVSEFVAGFESGKNLVADDEDDSSSTFRVLKVSAVTSLRFRPEESKALPPDYVPPPSHFVKEGDLLFSRANTAELIGATALVEHAPAGLVLPDKLWRFRWYDPPRADPRFVHWLFRQPRFRFELGRRATGTSGSMKNISQEKVFAIKVAFPPLSLQKKFGQLASAVERLRETAERALASSDSAFTSLQHHAYLGEL